MAKIKSPNEQYTGISAGVSFVNGVGECDDPERLKWFDRSGYSVDEVDTPDKPEGAEPDQDTTDSDKHKSTKTGK